MQNRAILNIFLKGIISILLFFLLWFMLSRIDWIDMLRWEEWGGKGKIKIWTERTA